jgi:PiT family inorganic phosphate transporter
MFELVLVVILVALVFDFINGFHDAANSIATVVSTRVLTPLQAVGWAAFFNFAAAFFFDTHVAKTIGKGMVDISIIDPWFVICALSGAIAWDLLTWWWGLPTSSSHALIGGYAGTALAKVGFSAILWSGWTNTMIFIVLSPLIGMVLSFTFMVIVQWLCKSTRPSRVDRIFRKLQFVSVAAYSLGHGTNDAQKTMGVITGVLLSVHYIDTFQVPFWVVIICHVAIALGTLSGGWRIVKTMGMNITKLQPVGGFCAEGAGAITLLGTAAFGIPVSTTHTITGAIVGVGATRRLSAVRWGIAGRIVWAWLLTIPAAAIISYLVYLLMHSIRG